jgi:hypothetical protein
MSLPDTSAVDEALVAVLSHDAALHAILPDGVAFDLAPQGWTQFVIVTQLAHVDVYSMTGAPNPASAYETVTYLVKAVAKGTSGLATKDGAARIHQLLQGASMPIIGYDLMQMERTERVRYTELDQATQDRWNHRGGHYDIWVTPESAEGDDPVGYYAIDSFGGDRSVYQQTEIANAYPTINATQPYAAVAPGTVLLVLDTLPADGQVQFELSARLQAAGGGVVGKAALFNMDRQTVIPGSELSFPADDVIGSRQRSGPLTLAPSVAYGVLITTSAAANGLAVWGAKLVHP